MNHSEEKNILNESEEKEPQPYQVEKKLMEYLIMVGKLQQQAVLLKK